MQHGHLDFNIEGAQGAQLKKERVFLKIRAPDKFTNMSSHFWKLHSISKLFFV